MANGRIVKASGQEDAVRLGVVGKVKVGKKMQSQNGKEYPTSLDYFLPSDDCKYKKEFHDAFGEKPTTIGIIFPSNNIQDVCNERYECRDGQGRLMAYGDGRNFQVWNYTNDQKTEGKYLDFQVNTEEDRQKLHGLGTWKTVLTLKFIITKIPGVLGCWMLQTNAVASSIPAIRDAFDMVLAKAGTVVGIPFDLHVKMAKSQKPGVNKKYPVISLVPNVSVDKIEEIKHYLTNGGAISEVPYLVRGMLGGIPTPAPMAAAQLPPPENVVQEPNGDWVDNGTGEVMNPTGTAAAPGADFLKP